MKVLEIQGSFGLQNLTVTERPRPELGKGEVLVRMRAASINYRDFLMIEGSYNPKQPLPLIPCSDGAGEVVAVGEGVTRFAVGDRVTTLFSQRWFSGEPQRDLRQSTLGGPLDGTLSQFMVLSEDGVMPSPAHLSDEQAATLTCAGLTAWSALVTHGDLRAGDRVLVLGTGGVSVFALQFARMLGARVIVTSSSDEKLERAKQLGASFGINYRTTPKWAAAVKELTAGQGVDHVVEVGGADTLPQSVRAVRPGGQISLVGNLTGGVLDFNIIPVFMRHLRIQGVLVGHRESFEAMSRAIEEHRMQPVVDRVFPWTEARQAFEYLTSGRHFGKICLRF